MTVKLDEKRRVEPEDLESLPVERRVPGSWSGLFLMGFACVWGGIPTVALILSLLRAETFDPAALFLLIFTVVGIAIFLGGLYSLLHTIHFRLDGQNIYVREGSIFGRTEWTEPLETYQGLLYDIESRGGSKNSYTAYVLTLYHPDEKKRVEIAEYRTETGMRSRWERAARALGLPAMEMENGEAVVRDPEDTDKSVRELAAEGKVELQFDPTAPPPAGIDVAVEGQELCLTITKGQGGCFGKLFALVFPLIFVYVGFFADDGPLVFGIFGLFFELIFLAAIVYESLTQARLYIAPDKLRLCRRTPWGETKGVTISADEIEAVRAGKGLGNAQACVTIVTDEKRHALGLGLPQDALEWVRDCILAAIAA